MFGQLLEQVTGIFDRRFLMHIFVPAMFFWALLIAVALAGLGILSETLIRWNAQAALPWTIQVLCFLIWVYLFSSIVSASLLAILKFYEGYWKFPGSSYFTRQGRKRHQKILDRLYATEDKDDRAYEEIYYFYPRPSEPSHVMPTRLGNILKSAELYPSYRYNINSVHIWPRLYRLFPQEFNEDVALARGDLDFMLVIASLSIVFALTTAIYLLIVRGEWWLFLSCFWGGLIVAWICYKSALSSALTAGNQVRVAFDLYRDELLKQMRVPLPANQHAEKIIWDQVSKFFFRNQEMVLPYRKADSASPSHQENKQ